MADSALPWPSRLMAVQYKVFDRIRDRRAFEVAREPGEFGGDLTAFRGYRQALIVTFKRSGEPVPTAVNFGLSDDGKLHFRSEPHVAKIKRLRRDPHVRVCPCNLRAKPLGPMVEAHGRILPDEESERSYASLEANWRPEMKVLERALDRFDVPVVYVEVTPVSAPGAAGG
jgi:PPOX class probable F420-dependent enzyme